MFNGAAHPHEDRAGHLPQAAGLREHCSPTTSWAATPTCPSWAARILSHDHFQGGRYTFAMAKAPIEQKLCLPAGFEDVEAGIVNWPMSVHPPDLCRDRARLVELADQILHRMARLYGRGVPLSTPRPTANPTTPSRPSPGCGTASSSWIWCCATTSPPPEHPLGVYHPHAKLHHIKKENIGLIEVMGLAVLPSRLKQELFDLADVLMAHLPTAEYPEALQKHAAWAEEILAKHPELNADNVHLILQDEVGHVFAQVLARCRCLQAGRGRPCRLCAVPGECVR